MLNWLFGGKQKSPDEITRKAPPYEEARAIAAGSDSSARKSLAECDDLQPEFLYFFATDKEPAIRRTVAQNSATPLQADIILAKDEDENVRSIIANKVSRLAPSVSTEENEKVAAMVFDILDILAHDSVPGVRAIVAEQICHLENVPKSIVSLLARDEETSVSGPILEHSPLLTEDDLIALIAKGLKSGALSAVSRRKSLSEEMAETVNTKITENALSDDTGDEEETRKQVRDLYETNALTGQVVIEAIENGRVSFVICALSLLGDLSEDAVRKLFTLRSARTIIAIVWKCGLDMSVAMVLQERGARLIPTNIIRPTSGTEFPLSEQDMEWQLDLL